MEPGSGNVGPGTAVEVGCGDRGGGGKGEQCMGLGKSSPDAGSGLAVFLAEQFVRLRGKFFSAAEVLRSGH